MSFGYTNSCFMDAPYRDGFMRVSKIEINDGFEGVRDCKWNRPRWVATWPNGDAEIDATTSRKAKRWGSMITEEYKKENRVLRQTYQGRGRRGLGCGRGMNN